jgi:hypothetical protein
MRDIVQRCDALWGVSRAAMDLLFARVSMAQQQVSGGRGKATTDLAARARLSIQLMVAFAALLVLIVLTLFRDLYDRLIYIRRLPPAERESLRHFKT